MSDALIRFEVIGELYYARFHRLRPGKSDVLRDSNEPDNRLQFENWLQTNAFIDAIDRIATLEEAKKNLAQQEVGNVLDHWEQLSNDIRSDPGFSALDHALRLLYIAVERDDPFCARCTEWAVTSRGLCLRCSGEDVG